MELFVNRILLIVEGEVREKDFFDRYKIVKKMENNICVVPFRQNIKELYRLCCDYIFDGIKPNNLVDILKDSNISSEDLKLLDGAFTDVYLIFDLDIQNAIINEKISLYLQTIEELISFFDDSTTIGQILINYPMMDSIYHTKDNAFTSYKDIFIPSDCDSSKNYKAMLSTNSLSFDCTRLSKNDFDMLSALNLMKANYVVNGNYTHPNAKEYEESINQMCIFSTQTNNIIDKGFMYVLNTSLFIDVDLFGRTLYFHQRGNRLYDEETLVNSLYKK